MATENALTCVTLVAGADLSAGQYLGVKLDGSGNAVLCSVEGEQVYGVLQNDPDTGEEGTVAIAGITKAEAGGVIAIGDSVVVASDGQFLDANDAAGTADIVVGIARSAAAAAGEIFSLDFRSHLGAS